MVVSKGKVVVLEYIMNDPFGNKIESSDELGLLDYLHGYGNMLPGVEKKLEDAEVGGEFKIVVQPADGYGKVNSDLIETFPKDNFDFEENPEIGMEVVLEADGEDMPAVIENISDSEITLNANHPLAGVVLHFEVKIVTIREATSEEIEQGQPAEEEPHTHN